jgi:biotin carboxyl carrier protein
MNCWMAGWLASSALVIGCGGDLRRQEAGGRAEPPSPTLSSVGEEAVVALDSATVARIGLRTITLTSATHPAELELPAVIVSDPGAGTTVRAGMGGRLSRVEGHSWPDIGQYLEAGTEIAQVGDARPVPVPRSGTVERILAQPGELVQSGQPLLELMDYTAPLARVAWTSAAMSPPSVIGFAPLGGGTRRTGKLQGPAPEADPVTGSAAFLYRLDAGSAALRPGAALVASYSGPAGGHSGVDVPNAAVVQWDALAWVYVEREPGKFARVRIPTEQPTAAGWRVERGLMPGDRVVTTGAGQLLSEEFRARIVVGEEVGE